MIGPFPCVWAARWEAPAIPIIAPEIVKSMKKKKSDAFARIAASIHCYPKGEPGVLVPAKWPKARTHRVCISPGKRFARS
jgi:hypothetical protein